jgi:glutamine amidotransferase
MSDVVVVDYGIGNIKSVQRGLEKVGATVEVTSDFGKIENAGRLVLPGVGAFKDGMSGLTDVGVVSSIHTFVNSGNPLLGICLGMQMLFEQSEENGVHEGLRFFPGAVKAIPSESDDHNRKVPHIGWSALLPSRNFAWENTPLDGFTSGEFVYFVHSFMGVTAQENHLIAQCEYEGLKITAAVNKENVTGCQFHPEKSGEAGLKILDKFVHKG